MDDEAQNRRSFIKVVIGLVLVLVLGITGYSVIEGWGFLDSLYMTVITLSTVGYGEVYPLSDAGKIFSSVLIVFGVGVALYVFTTAVQYMVKGQLGNVFGRRRMQGKIDKLNGHYIVCGYGRVGQAISRTFKAEKREFLVIDYQSEACGVASEEKCFYIQGDAADDKILQAAGIKRAKGLVAATDNDATNVFVIVSARKFNKNLSIISRASSVESESKLEAVGATRAINPYNSAGERIARLVLYPLVTDFVDEALTGYGKDLSLEDIEIKPKSTVSGRTVGEAQEHSGGASILAIKKQDGHMMPKPHDEIKIEPHDRLVILGTRDQLRLFEDTQSE